MKPRLISFYLPQYHPIPENDEWWGKGFTEWTNVAKAKPLFRGHYQPHLPADLGFYDLRLLEVREKQAELAREAGIEGFCYWHYWFGGKQLLERPFNEVLASRKPDFPFCLAWANESWTGIWHGTPNRVLMEQTYPGEEDHIAHFNSLLPAFLDHRYITVDGKPLFVIYKPKYLPFPAETLNLWQELAFNAGLKGLYIVGVINDVQEGKKYKNLGFNAFTLSRLPWSTKRSVAFKLLSKVFGKQKSICLYQKLFQKPFQYYDFNRAPSDLVYEEDLEYIYYPCVVPNWDNTPRSGLNGYVGINSSPALFKEQIVKATQRVDGYENEHRIIFIKSWNEWAEGNHLEPDQRFGHAYLQAIKDAYAEILK